MRESSMACRGGGWIEGSLLQCGNWRTDLVFGFTAFVVICLLCGEGNKTMSLASNISVR
jgi:hypothetical protein